MASEHDPSLLVLMMHKAWRDVRLPLTQTTPSCHLVFTAILFPPGNELKPLAITFPINSSFPKVLAATQVLKFKSLQSPITPFSSYPCSCEGQK